MQTGHPSNPAKAALRKFNKHVLNPAMRNALAAGRATIPVGGRSLDVADPRIIDAKTAAEDLPARRRREFARFGIDHFVEFGLATGSREEHRGA